MQFLRGILSRSQSSSDPLRNVSVLGNRVFYLTCFVKLNPRNLLVQCKETAHVMGDEPPYIAWSDI